MAMALNREPEALPETERPDAARAADSVRAFLERADARTSTQVTLDGDDRAVRVAVPEPALRLLMEVLRELASGNAVAVVSFRPEVTTQQAADLLNVSRPYVVKLLEEGRIPYRSVGPRRRIPLVDLLAFKREDDARRRRIADELTREAADLGMGYDPD